MQAIRRIVMATIAAVLFPATVWAVSPEVSRLQQEWAEINYRAPKETREQRFSQLVKVSEQMASAATPKGYASPKPY